MSPVAKVRQDEVLAARARSGDAAARAELAALYDPLAWKVARRYHHPSLTLEDLAQEARIGVLDAVARWEPGRGSFFSTASEWCRGRVAMAVKRAIRGGSWDQELSEDEELDVAERADERLERESDLAYRAGRVREALGRLDPRARRALELRYFSGGEPTHGEVAREMGVSRSLAQQVHAAALDALSVELAELA